MNEKRTPEPLAFGVIDAAAAMGIGKSKLWALISAGEIKVARIGGRTVVPLKEIEAFLDRKMA